MTVKEVKPDVLKSPDHDSSWVLYVTMAQSSDTTMHIPILLDKSKSKF